MSKGFQVSKSDRGMYTELSRRFAELEARHDRRFRQVFQAIRELIAVPERPCRPIGFITAGRSRRKKEPS
jgi:hypothetical protein